MNQFEPINKAYNTVFQTGKLSIGLVVPIENYATSPVPTMQNHLERVKLIEKLGFKALWGRDVPLNVPSFGDAGQTFDPFTYLGFLAGQTSKIALGVASIALPLHHPIHIAKSVATIDQLSQGRIILGVASGDRYEEYPALGFQYEKRGEMFRENFKYIRSAQETFPILETKNYGNLNGASDILPKPFGNKIPMLITGQSRQSIQWNAEFGDGWMYYPRNLEQQKHTIDNWRKLVAETSEYNKPFIQPLYVDLQDNDDFLPQPIHLGFKIGANHLTTYFKYLENIGVNHVAVNLRFNQLPIEQTLEKLAEKVLPNFHLNKTVKTQ